MELALHLQDQFDDLLSRNGVQSARGFVVQDDPRAQDQRPGQGHPPFHPARQFRRHQVDGVGEANAVKSAHDQFFLCLSTHPVGVTPQGKLQIFAHGHRVIKGAALKKEPHIGAQPVERDLIQVGYVLPEYFQGAGIDLFQPHDALQQDRFAGAALTYHDQVFAIVQIEVEAK